MTKEEEIIVEEKITKAIRKKNIEDYDEANKDVDKKWCVLLDNRRDCTK